MIRESEVKLAIRSAFETLSKVGEPCYSLEYVMNVLAMFKETWKNDPDNELLKYLSIGICEWIGDLAKEAYVK